MPNNDGSQSFFISTLGFIECCDCGLVHTVEFGKEGNEDIITYTRNEQRTRMAREARQIKESKMTMCERLDAALLSNDIKIDELSRFIEHRKRNLK